MSFEVRMMYFSKRLNSTLRPPRDGGTEYDCVLKDGSGLVSPVITLNLGLINPPTGFNYCYIPAFNRYYRVREWFFNDALWSAQLDCDVLASYKDQIGAATLYVLRSASFHNDNVVDEKYPMLASATNQKVDSDINFVSSFSAGTYVIGVLSGGNSATGAVSYYAMTPTNFSNFAEEMFSDDNFNISEITEDISSDLWKSLFNPYQYISACLWLPFEYQSGESVTKVKFGWWDNFPLTGSLINTVTHTIDGYITVPKHPQAATRGNYLNMSPFTSYILHIMPFGDIPIDGGKILNYSQLHIRILVDLGTGKAILTVYGYGGDIQTQKLLATQSCMLGVQIPIAQVNSDVIGTATSAVSGIAGVIGSVMKGDIAGAIQQGSSAVGNAVDNITPDLTGGGSQGSAAAFRENIALYATFHDVASWDVEHYGRPLMERRQISTCKGFVQVADGDVSLPATADECERVAELLESGFYYE